MKYIAQYLPIDGEIKPGDTFLDDTLGPCVRKDDGSNSTWVEWAGGRTNLVITNEHKKASLFLCYGDNWNSYEVIGEISPDAVVFVKHRQIIEESEWRRYWRHNESLKFTHLWASGDEHTNLGEGRHTLYIQIKCSSCKQFH